MAIESSDRYRLNIEALEAFLPELADAVDAQPIPDSVTPATGRDGCDTFRVRDTDGSFAWFGRSSMPSVSADVLLADFVSDGRNVVLPGVLTGHEPAALAAKVPAHTAVFVIEPSLLATKLAMHLGDYVSLLRSGRLVFMVAEPDDIVESFRRFFEAHPGYELPSHLLPVPYCSARQISRLQAQLELAAQVVVPAQRDHLQRLVDVMGARPGRPMPEKPRVAILGTDAGPHAIEQARRVARAMGAMGWTHRICVPDAPGQCHTLMRMAAVERVDADLVLFVNTLPGPHGAMLPSHVSPACWLLPEAVVPATVDAAESERTTFFAAAPCICDALIAAGVPTERIERCDVAADDTVHRPVELSEADRAELAVDVAVIADVPDDRPAVCQVELASHLVLWRALQDVTAARADRYTDAMATELVDEAQAVSGTSLFDDNMRAQFEALLKARIAPATLARVVVDTLVGQGYGVACWGYGWSESADGVERRRGAIPTGAALNRVYQGASVVVLPQAAPLSLQRALDALAGGASVVCRAWGASFRDAFPDLASLEPHLHFYETRNQLAGRVRKLLDRRAGVAEAANAARAMVMAEHTTARRLQHLVATTRRRRDSASAVTAPRVAEPSSSP